MHWVSASGLCRLDAALVARIRSRADLRGVAASSVLSIVVGGALYGAAFGMWRGTLQGLFSAVKLPLLLLLVVVFSVVAAFMTSALMRARLTLAQTSVCMLLSLAVTAIVLGALSFPVALIVSSFPSSDDLLSEAPAFKAGKAELIAQTLVLAHTSIVALAGIAGVIRLRALLRGLGLAPLVARRVLFGFIVAELAVGAQLSWLLRPFLGRAQTAVTFLAPDAFNGSFYREIHMNVSSVFGSSGGALLSIVLIAGGVWLWASLRDEMVFSERVELSDDGITMFGDEVRFVPWKRISTAKFASNVLWIELRADETLTRESVAVRCENEAMAATFADRIEAVRRQRVLGPLRTPAVVGD